VSGRRAGGPAWWATKMRQFRSHVLARVSEGERAGLVEWVPEPLLAVFDGMPLADRRHGLDVVANLRAAGGDGDPELLLAGLLHDCAKRTPDGRAIGLGPRIAWSLGEVFGPGSVRLAGRLPGYRPALDQLREHPERSATLVLAAGATARTADLIRDQDRVPVDRAGELLHLADEAS
jgi:hypothetical protein